eukprot:3179481-Prorocentrum_lima.AAC.1
MCCVPQVCACGCTSYCGWSTSACGRFVVAAHTLTAPSHRAAVESLPQWCASFTSPGALAA